MVVQVHQLHAVSRHGVSACIIILGCLHSQATRVRRAARLRDAHALFRLAPPTSAHAHAVQSDTAGAARVGQGVVDDVASIGLRKWRSSAGRSPSNAQRRAVLVPCLPCAAGIM
jgi:hypothetical protein